MRQTQSAPKLILFTSKFKTVSSARFEILNSCSKMFSLKAVRPIVKAVTNTRNGCSLIDKFDASVKKLPMREAIRYTRGNQKWTSEIFANHVTEQANALIDFEYKNGTTIAMWFPDNCPEKHVLLMTAAKCGYNVFDVNFSIDKVAQVRQFLTASQCEMLWCTAEDEERGDLRNDLLTVRKAVPEFFEYDDTFGEEFHSKHFPRLRKFVHSGYRTVHVGAIGYSEINYPHPEVDRSVEALAQVDENAPFYTRVNPSVDGNGIELEPTLTRAQVLAHPQWHFADKLIKHQYFECNNGKTAELDW